MSSFLRLLLLAAVWRLSDMKSPPPYSSDGECVNSTSEYYIKELRMCCSRCKPGTRLETRCTSDRDTVCLPCPAGQQSEKMNHYSNCFSCQKCFASRGLMYSRNCSADINAVCVCKPGMFCTHSSISACESCKRYKTCKAGEGVVENGTSTADVRCEPCPEGTFSTHRNTEPCQPHTRCEGGSVLVPGGSTADTQCAAASTASTSTSPSEISKNLRGSLNNPLTAVYETMTPSLPLSGSVTPRTTQHLISVTSEPSSEADPLTVIYCTGIVLLFILTVTVMVVRTRQLRKRRGLVIAGIEDNNKAEQSPSVSVTREHQCLLPGDRCQKEPSVTSSDSQSQPDSCHTHSSGDGLERTSQVESLPEQPSISSPVVNLSITATFNCQLNPATASCSIPVNPSALAPQTEAPVRLSQEEVCISCQQEDGKEALRSVQESGVF